MITYEELTPSERKVWDGFPAGRRVDLSGLKDRRRTVRASVLRALLLRASGEPGDEASLLNVVGARVTGSLILNGCEIRHLLMLEDCELEGRVSLAGATTQAIGFVGCRLPGIWAPSARIGGRLDLRRSIIGNVDDDPLQLLHTHIAGALRLDDAVVIAPGRLALSAGGLQMDGAIVGDRLRTEGGVLLPGARLSGGLFMADAHLSCPDGTAFGADNATASSMRCAFTAEGAVRLRGVQVADLLSFEGANLTTLSVVGARAAELDLRFAVPPTSVDLRNVQVSWAYDAAATWPSELRLHGFTYDSLDGSDAAARLGWIRRNPAYAAQPYEQLAGHFRRVGHDDEARRVLLAKQRHRRATARPLSRVWGYLFDATVGYGYRPWLAAVWLAVLVPAATLVFGSHTPIPVKKGEGAPFNALVYTLDLLIPIGGLGQRTAWYWPDQTVQWLAYLLIAIGWALTTAIVAGATRALVKT
ncbi:hypothetical protein ACWEPC_25450 [Nonomuraea sp. NPDC004297]